MAGSDNADPPQRLSILLLPGEILTKIMSFAVASNEPFHLEMFIKMARDPQRYQAEKERPLTQKRYDWVDTKEEYDRRNPTSAPALSRAWWFDLLPATQHEHYLDRLMVNGTSRALRECGKPAFFREKLLILSSHFLVALREGKVNRMRPFDRTLIISCVQDIVVPIPGQSSLTTWIMLHKYHFLENLKTLTVYTPLNSENVIQLHPSEKMVVASPPEALLATLKSLGLRADLTLKVCEGHFDPELKEQVIASIQSNVCPMLDNLLRLRGPKKVP
ncbi:MAG: hypothetical protein LQ350_000469 [Teloschistes chrysophthalmus]|nr:MAG: hypothetical protein LQ350_000469 [Niorma chrysophthalma]